MSSSNQTETSDIVPTNSSTIVSVRDDGVTEFVLESNQTITAPSDPIPPTMPDKRTLDDVLLRDHLIHTLTLNGAELSNVNLLTNFDPHRKFLDIPRVKAIMRNYTYYRTSLRVRVVCTPPGSCLGAAVVSAICEGGVDLPDNATYRDNEGRDSMFTAVNDTFRIVNFEQANSVEFELPWVYYYEFGSIRAAYPFYMWRMQMHSLVNIQSTISTSAAATIKIYAAFMPDYILSVPSYQMAPSQLVSKGKNKGVLDQARQSVKDKLGGNTVSGLASTVSKGAAAVAAAVPVLAPFAAPLAAGAATVSSMASFFGFTRDAEVNPPEPYIGRLSSNLACVDTIDTGEKLSMLQGSALAIGPGIGGGDSEDPMCFESIRRRWGIISSFTITTSSAAGTILHTLPVTPFYAGIRLGIIYPTPGGYYGLPSQGWRGGMEYLIYIPSSSNMRGLLQVYYDPVGNDTTVPAVGPDPTGYYHSVGLDLSSTQQHMLSVPYTRELPYLDRQVMADGVIGRDSSVGANGCLRFYLTTPWVAPRAGSITTNVIILARPAADMVYVEPSGAGTVNQSIMTFAYQSAAVDDSVDLFESTMLSEPEEDFKLDMICATEVFPSARALCQKPCYVGDMADSSYEYRFPFYPNLPSTQTGIYNGYALGGVGVEKDYIPSFTWLTHYSALFVGIRGSVRYKMIPSGISEGSTSPLQGSFYAFSRSNTNYDNHANWTLGINHFVVQPFSINHSIEFQFPYTFRKLYQNPRRLHGMTYNPFNGAHQDRQVGFRRLGTFGFGGTAARLGVGNVVTVSAGDDFSVNRFRRTPCLRAVDWMPPNP